MTPEFLRELEDALKPHHDFQGHKFDTSQYVTVDSGSKLVDAGRYSVILKAAHLLQRIMPEIEKMVNAREMFAPDEWFAGNPTTEEDTKAGLCQVDDGQTMSGMYAILCEWYEGRFIATAANSAAKIGEILGEVGDGETV